MKDPLKCYACDETFATIPKLKVHLEADFRKLKKKALADAEDKGRKRKLESTDSEVKGKDNKQASENAAGEKKPKVPKVSGVEEES